MSDYINAAIKSAMEAKPTDFKDSIYSAIRSKVDDAMFAKKMHVANQIFNNQEEKEESSEYDSELNSEEENIDEDI